MARALSLPARNSLFETHSKLTLQQGRYSYTLEKRDDQILYIVTDGQETISAPIVWAFGANSQTYLLKRDGRYFEGLVSYYLTIDGLDITIGDQRIHPETLSQAFGRELSDEEVQNCIGCHSTGAVVRHSLHLDTMEPGVTCQHCHAGAQNHLQAISQGKLESVPPKLNRLSPEDVSNFCGQCHRTWETVTRGGIFGKVNVRFQPYRLENSKCFDGGDARISCIACHDPHHELVREEKTYDSRCVACHSSDAKPSVGMIAMHKEVPAGRVRMKTCPVSRTDCVSCHMQKVNLPGGHMVFTDHDIRVVRTKEEYPN